MGLGSSLNAGVQGLNVNSTRLATIADNIANSGTVGYKRSSTEFSAMVLGSGSGGKYAAGGVRASVRGHISEKGLIAGTSSSTDIAVDGRGFLPTTSTLPSELTGGAVGEFLLKTTGSFLPDANGFLRDASGHYLLGWELGPDGTPLTAAARDSANGLSPVTVRGTEFIAAPTTQITLAANLPAEATKAGGTGDPVTMPVEYFNNVGASETLTLVFEPSVPGVGQSNLWTVRVNDSASTPSEVASFDIQFDDTMASGGTILDVPAGSLVGATYDGATGMVDLSVAGGPISIDIGTIASGKGLTQYAGAFAPIAVNRDGAAFGSLSNVEITDGGIVEAIFDNGQRRPLFQVPVVDVVNPDGLMRVDGQALKLSSESGPFYLWDAGQGPVGNTAGYSLEGSTTDVADELTNLIETQRAYSSNAKVIRTVDEMLQETTNIKR
ncbi:MAG: flagellar hook protein FlgE [Geminicoccaceae bacterium]